MMFSQNTDILLSMLDAAPIVGDSVTRASDRKSKLRIKNYGCKGIHGAREMERRKRQIERGQLKVQNGLIA